MTALDLAPAAPPEQWPCGPDCQHAEPLAAPYENCVWCRRPEAAARAIHLGRECLQFRSDASAPAATASFASVFSAEK